MEQRDLRSESSPKKHEAEEIVENLASRIKELREQIYELEGKRLELAESIRDTKVELLEALVVKAYVEDLRSLLGKGPIVEQKSFLRSFVKRTEVSLPKEIIDYTIPLEIKKPF